MAVGRFRRGSSHVQRGAILTCLAQRIMCEFDPKTNGNTVFLLKA